jgi:hypothetical protein
MRSGQSDLKELYHRVHRGRREERKGLAAEVGDEPEEEREGDAEEDGSGDGEIEGRVWAAMDDVTGETAEAEREAAGEIEEGAGGEENGAEDEEGAAEVAGGIHEGEFSAQDERRVPGWKKADSSLRSE